MSKVMLANYTCECSEEFHQYWKDYSEPEECPNCGEMVKAFEEIEVKMHLTVAYDRPGDNATTI